MNLITGLLLAGGAYIAYKIYEGSQTTVVVAPPTTTNTTVTTNAYQSAGDAQGLTVFNGQGAGFIPQITPAIENAILEAAPNYPWGGNVKGAYTNSLGQYVLYPAQWDQLYTFVTDVPINVAAWFGSNASTSVVTFDQWAAVWEQHTSGTAGLGAIGSWRSFNQNNYGGLELFNHLARRQ